jgi:hypothetical protein
MTGSAPVPGSHNVTVKDCDISSPYPDSRRLMVGVKDIYGDATDIKVTGNNIWHTATGVQITAGLEDFGVEANKLIKDNLAAGGGYSIYAGAQTGGPHSYNIRVIGNRFSRRYYANGGQFGPAVYFNDGGRGNVWSGNIWDGTEAAVSSP